MAREYSPSLRLVAPSKAAEIELYVVKQEYEARFTDVQIPLGPEKRVGSIQRQLSPISFLPNEILIQIFKHGLEETHAARALPAPTTVVGVCRSWRAVVLRTPELWTHVFMTSATPIDRLQTYIERSGNFDIDVSFCRWPFPRCTDEVDVREATLRSIASTLHYHAHRLRSLSIWDASDVAVCMVIKGLLNSHLPRLTNVSIKANHTVYTHYYQLRDSYLLPFLRGGAPSLTHLDVDHFPIETLPIGEGWPFKVQDLTSLTLRTQECSTRGFILPPYLIEFPALCALLRSTPSLVTLALYGPVIEPDEDFPARPPAVTLPLLETLIVHRRDPGVRYHCELLNVLIAPHLKRLELPFHDDLTAELPYMNRAVAHLLDGEGQPRFGSVRELYLHDSAAPWQMPTRSLMKAFPNVEEVVLGGTDIAKFAATLRGFVRPGPAPACLAGTSGHGSAIEGVLADGAWQTVTKVVLKEPEMTRWRGWVRGFCKWLAAGGHAGPVCIEIQAVILCEGELDQQGARALRRGLDRLRKHAQVIVT